MNVVFLIDSAEGNRKQFRWFLKKKLLINFFQLSLIFHSNCKKFICGKEARVQTPLKSGLNLFSEPQHLVQIKTPKLLKIPNKGVTNLRKQKLKTAC